MDCDLCTFLQNRKTGNVSLLIINMNDRCQCGYKLGDGFASNCSLCINYCQSNAGGRRKRGVDVSAVAAVELQSGGGAKAPTVAKKSAGRASERNVPNIEGGHALVVDTQTGNGIFPSHESVTDWVAAAGRHDGRRCDTAAGIACNANCKPQFRGF